ncbi:FAD-binding oxidoreductase [Bordetella genomosp. 12]|uniref:FAD-binding oxidoreductase n=1 Tax=Bordetella genomosp. 12 TaxID=463035 RepID=A0A261VC47_9BORD|nr:FAD-binding oxidoreductase [Bordetella genomosp. 12]OZI71669.1 FAD-binding oxidoreductase [Bordetella genomosp. 12]
MTVDERYLRDWSGLTRGVPQTVHQPASTDEVAALVRQARREGKHITVQGGLTGLAGGAVPADGDVVINMGRMNRIEYVDDVEGIMQVQAGATLQQVQEAAAAAGWFFPVDFAARGSCQIGGNAATNAGGTQVLRYGTLRDSVLGIEAVLADGEIVTSLTRLVKNSSGLDLRFLFIGSEGTLGIITRLTLRLQPPPGASATALAQVPDIASLSALLRHLRVTLGPQLTAYEFMSAEFLQQASELTGVASPLGPGSAWSVLIQASGGADAHANLEAALTRAYDDGLVTDCAVAASLADADKFWRLRESIPELMSTLKPTVNFDCGLPMAQMPDFVEQVQRALQQRYPQARHLFMGHLGDNNIHILTGPHPESEWFNVEEIVYSALRGRQGTISAEHGIGFLKKPFLGYTRSAGELQLLQRIKRALDPDNTLNPGRIFD